jgi:hypothetical protein
VCGIANFKGILGIKNFPIFRNNVELKMNINKKNWMANKSKIKKLLKNYSKIEVGAD